MLKTFTNRLLLVLTATCCAGFGDSLLAQTFSLTRKYEPIIVSVQKLPPLLNDSIRVYTAYCYINGEFRRSRFQIDEVTSSGEYLIEQDAIADANDEVVFMPNGIRDRAPTDKWVDGSDSTRLELEVTDPLTNEKGWLYLFQHVKNPPFVGPHVRYSPAPPNAAGADTVFGESYIEGHVANVRDAGWFTDITIKAPFGNGKDIFDRQKVRVVGTIVIGVPITITIKEEQLQFVDVRFVQGPVRSFRELSYTITLVTTTIPFAFNTQYFPYSTVFGAKNVTLPSVQDLTFNEIRQSADFNEQASGMKFFNAFNSGGILVDGVTDALVDRTITDPPDSINWFMVTGDPGTYLTLIDVPLLGTKRELYYKDNSAVDTDDTGDKKSYGDSGLLITSPAAGTRLNFDFTTYYFEKNQTAAAGAAFKQRALNPLQVTAVEQTRTITSVSENAPQPADFRLDEARPNPFAPREGSVQISFDLGRTNLKPALRIFNLLGQEVARFDAANLLRSQTVLWDGRDRSGHLAPAGIYFYELTVGRQRAVKKLILLR
jgi:hypothetical protein